MSDLEKKERQKQQPNPSESETTSKTKPCKQWSEHVNDLCFDCMCMVFSLSFALFLRRIKRTRSHTCPNTNNRLARQTNTRMRDGIKWKNIIETFCSLKRFQSWWNLLSFFITIFTHYIIEEKEKCDRFSFLKMKYTLGIVINWCSTSHLKSIFPCSVVFLSITQVNRRVQWPPMNLL